MLPQIVSDTIQKVEIEEKEEGGVEEEKDVKEEEEEQVEKKKKEKEKEKEKEKRWRVRRGKREKGLLQGERKKRKRTINEEFE